MKHKLHGDVPEEHLKIAEELIGLEEYFESKAVTFPSDLMAKGYVCLAADWYAMGDEDKGRDLLDKAVKVCPTYFDREIKIQTQEDPTFNLLVRTLSANIVALFSDIVYGEN
jgi:hypothetical protein